VLSVPRPGEIWPVRNPVASVSGLAGFVATLNVFESGGCWASTVAID
jgi:hypothetical protein